MSAPGPLSPQYGQAVQAMRQAMLALQVGIAVVLSKAEAGQIPEADAIEALATIERGVRDVTPGTLGSAGVMP